MGTLSPSRYRRADKATVQAGRRPRAPAHQDGADVILALLLAAASSGKLVVVVVIDQLRYQDLLWLAPELGPKGFAGLGRPAPMRYDTVVTETAADHAALATGTYAELNGTAGTRLSAGDPAPQPLHHPPSPAR